MRAPQLRDDGLQLEEQRAYQRVFWTVERWAWGLFALLLLLALAGLTGAGGYLVRAKAVVPTGEVDYLRVARWESSEEMRVTFNAGGDIHRLTLDPVLFEHFQVEGIQPQPERSFATQDGIAIEFAAEQNASVETIIYLRALRSGFLRYTVILDGATSNVSTVILP